MILKKWIQAILIGSCIVGLTACSSAHKRADGSAVNDANLAYNDAESSGLGEEASFGDHAGGGKQLAKRTYYFDFDSNVVHDEDKPAIEANASYMQNHGKSKVIAEGHTDPRGSREYNIGLGERRAKAVTEILTSKGANPGQIRVVSYGAEKLASSEHTENGYQMDRRVVLDYMQ